VSNYFDFSPVELTLEANPESLNKTKVIKYRKIGINRLSLGIQSLCKKGLTFLGRIHTVDQNFKVLEIVSRYFENFSLDFIFGWKGQGEKTLKKEIEKLEKEMKQAAKNYEFEKAAILRDKLLALKQLALQWE